MNNIETELSTLLSPSALVLDEPSKERYFVDWARTAEGQAEAIVRPASTEEVARCIAWCNERGIAVVPQGGHTGLVGGATPMRGQRQVVLSLERLNKIRSVDPLSNTITVEAGVVLQRVQEAAAAQDRMFPLSLGAEGSCQIGGCISTNAGGTAVLRYGNTRDLVLGLEVVLPDGSIWRKLNTLRKDNTGYDLKQLFIGAEGTLGVVTAATLRVFPRPRQTLMAMAAVPNSQAVLDLFVRVRDNFDSELTAFEFMSGECLALSCKHLDVKPPVDETSSFAVMVEVSSSHAGEYFYESLLDCLSDASEAGAVTDAVLASSEQQASTFWSIRESIPEAMLQAFGKQRGGHDISIPIAHIPEFLTRCEELIKARWKELGTLIFGHVGDGNLHYNFVAKHAMDDATFKQVKAQATDALYEMTSEFEGSISAEHGIGTHKLAMLERFSEPAHLDLMRQIKTTIDRKNLMNPGKILGSS